MKKPYVSPEYAQRLDNLAETLTVSRYRSLGDAAMQSTVEFPPVTEQLYLDFDAEHLVRATE